MNEKQTEFYNFSGYLLSEYADEESTIEFKTDHGETGKEYTSDGKFAFYLIKEISGKYPPQMNISITWKSTESPKSISWSGKVGDFIL